MQSQCLFLLLMSYPKFVAKSTSRTHFPLTSSSSFTVSVITFKSLIHSKLVCVCVRGRELYKTGLQFQFSVYDYPIFPTPLRMSSPKDIGGVFLFPFSVISCLYKHGFIPGLLILFHLFM